MIDYASFPDQRQALIQQRIQQQGRVVCVQLAQELQVSEHTIRRDLQELASRGICKKVYGGAVSLALATGYFADRVEQQKEQKQKLGAACAALLRDDACVFIDVGSTNLAVAKAISKDKPLTLVTHAPAIALELMKLPQAKVILLGGTLNTAIGAAFGIGTLRQLQSMYFDQCLLGACSLDVQAGLCTNTLDDAEFKQAIVQQSSEVLVALTSDKVGTMARHQVIAADAIHQLVLEGEVSDSKLQALLDKNIQLYRV
ncbi:DeoR/GlpR family DNA-binding transcription regulator [Rheinheimera sp.]|uniref:DeoR/GlpR family DNA-binding transcription regulator n=1 Tax=Rheinheimera sp. TaxID=1869214 RepID=UPI003AF4EC15